MLTLGDIFDDRTHFQVKKLCLRVVGEHTLAFVNVYDFYAADIAATGKPDAGQKIIYADDLKVNKAYRLPNPHLHIHIH